MIQYWINQCNRFSEAVTQCNNRHINKLEWPDALREAFATFAVKDFLPSPRPAVDFPAITHVYAKSALN
jgi:hypothetical protein